MSSITTATIEAERIATPRSMVHLGMDVQKDSITIAVLHAGAKTPERLDRIPNDLAKLLMRFVDQVADRGKVQSCHEASSAGYVIHRAMREWGYPCDIIATSLIPKRPGVQRNHDKRDASELAKLHRAGELTAVRAPSGRGRDRPGRQVTAAITFDGAVDALEIIRPSGITPMLLTLWHGKVMARVRAGLHSLEGRRLRPISRAVALTLAFAGCARPAVRSVQREVDPRCLPTPIAADAVVLSALSESSCMLRDRMQDLFDLTFDSTTLVRVVASSPDFAISVGIGERDGPLGAGAAGTRGAQAPSILYLAGAGTHRVTITGTAGQYRLTLQSNPTITRCESIVIMPGTAAALPLRPGVCRDSLRPGDGLYNTARFTLMYRSPGSRITVTSSDFTPTITLQKGSTAWPDARTSSTTLDYPCPDCTGANFMKISGTRPSDSGTFTIRVESKPNGREAQGFAGRRPSG